MKAVNIKMPECNFYRSERIGFNNDQSYLKYYNGQVFKPEKQIEK